VLLLRHETSEEAWVAWIWPPWASSRPSCRRPAQWLMPWALCLRWMLITGPPVEPAFEAAAGTVHCDAHEATFFLQIF